MMSEAVSDQKCKWRGARDQIIEGLMGLLKTMGFNLFLNGSQSILHWKVILPKAHLKEIMLGMTESMNMKEGDLLQYPRP